MKLNFSLGRSGFIPVSDLPPLPPGYAYLVHADGAYVIGADGAYLFAETPDA